MNGIDAVFCRSILTDVMKLVRKHTSATERTKAWVYKTGRQSWEFHGPSEFYWYGRAANAWDARAQGWTAWLSKKGVAFEDEGGN